MKNVTYGTRIESNLHKYLTNNKELEISSLFLEFCETYVCSVDYYFSKKQKHLQEVKKCEQKIQEIKLETEQLKTKLVEIGEIELLKTRIANGFSSSSTGYFFNKRNKWDFSLPAYIELKKEMIIHG